ncbi:hypothetical protein LCGC14_0852510 [marine sediment metagenome]|uniref:Uncharacterized protein n=1 Tax=marine sediment metagenome TaxID=412755 RepID=A0A0F9RUD0_9ZZZZ
MKCKNCGRLKEEHNINDADISICKQFIPSEDIVQDIVDAKKDFPKDYENKGCGKRYFREFKQYICDKIDPCPSCSIKKASLAHCKIVDGDAYNRLTETDFKLSSHINRPISDNPLIDNILQKRDFKLSDKIENPNGFSAINILGGFLFVSDVKEFIRRLKEEFCECKKHERGLKLLGRNCWFCEKLNKLVGDDLL